MLDQLMKNVEDFFKENRYSNLNADGIDKSTNPGMSLLEIVCLGSPEKTIQGELLFYLRCSKWNVVQEVGYRNAFLKRRNSDLAIFDSFFSNKN